MLKACIKGLYMRYAAPLLIFMAVAANAQDASFALNPYMLRQSEHYQHEQLSAYRTLLPYFQQRITTKCNFKTKLYPSPRWQIFVLEADSNNYTSLNQQVLIQMQKNYRTQGDKLLSSMTCTSPALKAWHKAVEEDIIGYTAALIALKEISNLRDATNRKLIPR